MPIEVNGVRYETDENGYLVNLEDWTEDIACGADPVQW